MSWLWSARFIIVKIGVPLPSRAWSTRTLSSIAVGLLRSSAVVGNRPGISCFRPAGTGNSTSRRDQREGLAVVARTGDGAGVARVVQGLRSLVDSTREVDAFPAAVVVVVAERLGRAARVVEVAGAVGVLVGLLEPPQARPVVDVARAGDPPGGVDLGKVLEILRGVEGGRGGIDLRRPDAPGCVRPRGWRHRGDEKHRH